ncbi:MAG: 23S rRNA (guanosine(2251)-2'-O)-methyltransferase RlmB [Rhodothermales bacterium]
MPGPRRDQKGRKGPHGRSKGSARQGLGGGSGQGNREEDRSRYVAGRNPAREHLETDASRIEKVLLQKGGSGSLKHMEHLAREVRIPVQFVPKAKLDQLVPGVNHQGVVLAVAPIQYLDVDDMLSRIAPSHDDVRILKPVVVILDHIQDPHNLGAIIRSCAATGVKGVIIPERGAAPVTAASVKTSAGTFSQVMVARTSSLPQLIEQLKERGYWIAGADGGGETKLAEMDWDRPLALVIGSEEKGMSRSVAGACDYRVSIPMESGVESLNASVAAALLLFQAYMHRISS